mgnify:CR=1 FL=1
MAIQFKKFTVFIAITCFYGLSVLGQYQSGTSYFGTNNYIEYHAGDLPIIISAPHGGYIEPSGIPDRSCSSCVTVRDGGTEEISYDLDSAIQQVFGGRAHIIINKLARKKLDANREIGQAAMGNTQAETAWHEYHQFIQAAKDSCVAKYGTALYIDLHAHGHPNQRIELGYLLRSSQLRLPNNQINSQNLHNSCSIKHLKNVLNPSTDFSELLRGSECMGELLHDIGYPSVPSASDTAPAVGESYFNGGYNTARHGSRDSTTVNGIQFELNYQGIRNSSMNRQSFAEGLACVLKSYLDKWYFDVDAWDPGHVVTSAADSGPGSLRSALVGAENGTVITFDSTLLGDTIKLLQPLQFCNDVRIDGPSAHQITISGEDTVRIGLIMQNSSVEINRVHFINGKAQSNQDGGAFLIKGNLKLSNCIVSNNHATDDGGAIAVIDSASIVTLDSCLIDNNSCDDDGGALRVESGTLNISYCTVSNNFSNSFGGGISNAGNINISYSSFYKNRATTTGGGIRNFSSGSITSLNSTFTENSCGYRGGAISSSADLTLNFCTVVNNQSTSIGGGLRAFSGKLDISNSIIANNSGSAENDIANASAQLTSNGHNLISDTVGSKWITTGLDIVGNTILPANPLLRTYANNGGITNTFSLSATSPCVDMADTANLPVTDQRGRKRLSGLNPDLGAYELCTQTFGFDTVIACSSYTWLDGKTYTNTTDTITFTMQNNEGCDSVIRLNLRINTASTFTDSAVACDEFTWLNGRKYTVSDTSSQLILQNQAGCDSVVSLHLTIHSSSEKVDSVVTCTKYTWINNVQYTSSDTASLLFVNQNGCDSIVRMDLTVNSISDNSIKLQNETLVSNNSFATFQWLDCDDNFSPIPNAITHQFQPDTDGQYAVQLTEKGCIDTSACERVEISTVEPFSNSMISIFPNPSSGKIILLFPRPINGTIVLIDAIGQNVGAWKLESDSKKEINLELSNGNYLLKIESESGEFVEKRLVIIQ